MPKVIKLGFLGLSFFFILAPTSSIIPIADLAVEHRMYLPLAAKYVKNSRRVDAAPATLFDVRNDVGEMQEVSANHPDIVQRLTILAEAARQELGDVNKPGRGQRPAGHVATPQPLVP